MADNYIAFTREEMNMMLWGLLGREATFKRANDRARARQYRDIYTKLDDAYNRNGTMIVELPDEC